MINIQVLINGLYIFDKSVHLISCLYIILETEDFDDYAAKEMGKKVIII